MQQIARGVPQNVIINDALAGQHDLNRIARLEPHHPMNHRLLLDKTLILGHSWASPHDIHDAANELDGDLLEAEIQIWCHSGRLTVDEGMCQTLVKQTKPKRQGLISAAPMR
jgi:hypothetical protein